MEHVTVKEQRSSKKKHGLGTPNSKGDLCAVFGSKNDRWSLEKYVLNFTLIFRDPGSHCNLQRNHRKVTFLLQKLFWASQNKSNQSNEFIQHGFGMGEKVS